MAKLRSHRGVSLLEVIVAVMLFASIATALNGIWIIQYRMMSRSRVMILGAHYAEQLCEEALESGYDGVTAWALTYPPDSSTLVSCSMAGKVLTNELFPFVEVNDVGEFKQVTVRVTWLDKGIIRREVKYDVLLAPTL